MWAKFLDSVVFSPFLKPAGRSPPEGNLLTRARVCRRSTELPRRAFRFCAAIASHS